MRKLLNEKLPISESSPLKARFFHYDRFTYPWHFHSEYEIIYLQRGVCTRFVGNSVGQLSSGDVLLLGSDLPHFMKSEWSDASTLEHCGVEGTIIQFEKQFMYYSMHHYPHFFKIKKLLEESKQGILFPSGTCSAMYPLLESLPLLTGIDQITGLLQLFKHMSESTDKHIISTNESNPYLQSEHKRMDKILAYLHRHYTRKITLEEIATVASMNPSAFCRFFKQTTGKSFTHYLQQLRITYACKLLLVDTCYIADIAAECGFEATSYFNKCFKTWTGYNPLEYKRIMLNS